MIGTAMERAQRYEAFYRDFESQLMSRIRLEAYGEDIGQHSWVGADELRGDTARLGLGRSSRLLDLGCGPCGPLTFVMAASGCSGTGVELSPAALGIGRARAETLGVDARLTLVEADLNAPLPLEAASFDAVMSLDVILHLRDRATSFREVARLLMPEGRFLFTDAGVVTGAISSEEVTKRSLYGSVQFVTPGWNEDLIASAGFRLIETEDRTASVVRNAGGRLAAITAHRAELEDMWGADEFKKQRAYLETVVALSRRGALSRVMYLAGLAPPTAGH
jgi:SAM-dependent methyltransferase